MNFFLIFFIYFCFCLDRLLYIMLHARRQGGPNTEWKWNKLYFYDVIVACVIKVIKALKMWCDSLHTHTHTHIHWVCVLFLLHPLKIKWVVGNHRHAKIDVGNDQHYWIKNWINVFFSLFLFLIKIVHRLPTMLTDSISHRLINWNPVSMRRTQV